MIDVMINGRREQWPDETDRSGWAGAMISTIRAIAKGTLQKTGGMFTLSSELNFGLAHGIKVKDLKFGDKKLVPDETGTLTFNGKKIVYQDAIAGHNQRFTDLERFQESLSTEYKMERDPLPDEVTPPNSVTYSFDQDGNHKTDYVGHAGVHYDQSWSASLNGRSFIAATDEHVTIERPLFKVVSTNIQLGKLGVDSHGNTTTPGGIRANESVTSVRDVVANAVSGPISLTTVNTNLSKFSRLIQTDSFEINRATIGASGLYSKTLVTFPPPVFARVWLRFTGFNYEGDGQWHRRHEIGNELLLVCNPYPQEPWTRNRPEDVYGFSGDPNFGIKVIYGFLFGSFQLHLHNDGRLVLTGDKIHNEGTMEHEVRTGKRFWKVNFRILG